MVKELGQHGTRGGGGVWSRYRKVGERLPWVTRKCVTANRDWPSGRHNQGSDLTNVFYLYTGRWLLPLGYGGHTLHGGEWAGPQRGEGTPPYTGSTGKE